MLLVDGCSSVTRLLILVFFVISTVATTAHTIKACDAAVSTLGTTKTVLPSNTQYEVLRNANWAATARLSPSCIVQVSNAQELSAILKIIAQSGDKFAVRSGGHEVEPGFGSIDGGVLIDLAGINEITVNEVAANVVAGTGNRWPAVYAELDKHNLTVVGGRANNPGLGGFLLGGGLSYLANKHGLACDNVENFEVVLANGTIVNANATSNKDLFWALKGGSNNFGVVTKFTLRTYLQGLMWGGTVAYPYEKTTEVLSALATWQQNGASDFDSNVFVVTAPTNDSTVGTAVTFFHAQPEPWPTAFSPFFNITSVADLTTIQNMTTFVNSAATGGLPSIVPRLNWRSTAISANETLYYDAFDLGKDVAQQLSNVTGGTLALGFQPVHANTAAQGKLKGGNPLGLREESQLWFSWNTGWYFPSDDVYARTPAKEGAAKLEDLALSRGLYQSYVFQNDASKDQPVMRRYGEENLARLKRVQIRYDPTRFFERQQPGGFKLY